LEEFLFVGFEAVLSGFLQGNCCYDPCEHIYYDPSSNLARIRLGFEVFS
jgi:hypothetical protein